MRHPVVSTRSSTADVSDHALEGGARTPDAAPPPVDPLSRDRASSRAPALPMMLDALMARLPEAVRGAVRASLDLPMTAADLHAAVAHLRTQRIRFLWDDGAYGLALHDAVFDGVIRTPELGIALVLRAFRRLGEPRPGPVLELPRDARGRPIRVDVPPPEGAARRRRVALPVAHLTLAPEVARLLDPADASAALAGGHGGCAGVTAGRYCPDCGVIVRRGPVGVVLGRVFRHLQRALREVNGRVPGTATGCTCGALVPVGDRYCTKCGRDARSAETAA